MAEQHFLSNVRWLVSHPSMPLPQAFFIERVARRKAQAISEAIHAKVQVERQDLINGQWVSSRRQAV